MPVTTARVTVFAGLALNTSMVPVVPSGSSMVPFVRMEEIFVQAADPPIAAT